MTKFGQSQYSGRREDQRFLTGAGRYIDDHAVADALVVFFLRAPVAHARITTLQTAEARALPGVHLVMTAADLDAAGFSGVLRGAQTNNRDGTLGALPIRQVLADQFMRFVGEPVVMIAAETMAQAKDAAEAIDLRYETLPAALTLAPGAPTLHPEAPMNTAFDWAVGQEQATMAALENAKHRVRLSVLGNRIIANSMEPRGAQAEWLDGHLHMTFNGQGVWQLKADLMKHFNLPAQNVRVTIPDVGGGFGMKSFYYPEHLALAAGARLAGRPLAWMSERTEAMLSDNAGRDLVAEAELGFDADYRITGYRVDVRCNLGAYNSQFAQEIQSTLFSKVLTGAYDIKNAFMTCQGFYTNTTPVDAYRGAGRPEAITTLERAMDHAARVLGQDPWALRRRNFIAPDAFPYATASGGLYDVGEFTKVLDRAYQVSDAAGFPARRTQSQAQGKLRGLGLAFYIESILGNPVEAAEIRFEPNGRVSLRVGTQSNGQGHETVYSAFLAQQTGIPVEQIDIIQGDSDEIPEGGGTGGSRSVTVQNSATLNTTTKMVADFTPFLAQELGIKAQELQFEEGTFQSPATNRRLTLLEAADLARTHGRTDLLRHRHSYELEGRSFPNGAHVVEVEIDPDTGETAVLRYAVTDDFGVIMNEKLVEGQVHGGIAQGLGQALCEQVVFDENGQLLTATFMDYAMPRATDMPPVVFTTECVPSLMNPIGMKGCGEAGTVGSIAAVSNAVLDALWSRGVRHIDMPLTPHRVWQYLQAAKA